MYMYQGHVKNHTTVDSWMFNKKDGQQNQNILPEPWAGRNLLYWFVRLTDFQCLFIETCYFDPFQHHSASPAYYVIDHGRESWKYSTNNFLGQLHGKEERLKRGKMDVH